MNLLVFQNTKIAFESISSQLLRTIITVLIIAFGIMALVGILTAIDGIKQSLNNTFTSFGANTFTLRNKGMALKVGHAGLKPKKFRQINYNEATAFKAGYTYPATCAVSAMGSQIATLKYESKKSNPNIMVFGGDENYISTSGYEMDRGRNFSESEMQYGSSVVIIGSEIVNVLFSNHENPLDKIISIGSGKYKIIGVLKEKGSSMSFGRDKICLIPLANLRVYFSRPNMSFVINVMANDAQSIESAIGEATGLFRIIRKVNIGDEDNFDIVKSDNLAHMLIDKISYVTLASTLIGFITLLGAAIGLMNIMLVSVSERTREIGIRKAVGANSGTIKRQFLVEAVIICQIGGVLGIILGIAIGNVTSFFVGGGFIVPWLWMGSGIILCFIVGMASGIYPAIKASRLDPIEALRFE